MVLRNKNILLISPEPWEHLFVSKHHYAIHLGIKDNKVFFLNPTSDFATIDNTEYRNVFSVRCKGFPRGLRFYPSFVRSYFIRKKFEELQNQCRVAFDLIWSFDNSVFFDFSALPKSVLRICHIVDLNQDFQLKKAASTADYCFCPSDILKKKLNDYNSNTFKISHAYAASEYTASLQVSLPGKSNVKVFYAGNLDIPYLDWTLIRRIVSENRHVDFCFAGSKSDTNENMVTMSNIGNFFYLGKLTSYELPAYSELADIMLLVYRADEFREQLANPHKVMEYLAAGKVIVATYTDELKHLQEQELVCMSNTNAEFCSLFSSVLRNLSEWNSAEKIEKRKRIASENTYDKQIDRIESIIRHD